MPGVVRLQYLPRRKPRIPTNRFIPKRKPEKADVSEPRTYTRDIVLNIHKILKYSTWESAREELRNLRIRWDSHIINQVLKTHPPMQKAWLFFNWTSALKGFKHDHFTYTTMLDIFGEAGRIESMYFVFEQMKEKGISIDAVTYTSLIHWVSSSGDVDGAVRLWKEMRDNGCEPTVVTYTAYMKILFADGRVKEASDLYKEMLRSGITPNCHTYTVLMDYLVGAGKCKEALDIFLKIQETGVMPDKAACNILIEKSCKSRQTYMIEQILLYMKENCLVLRYPVFLEALETLKAAGESDDLLREVNPHITVESVDTSEMYETTVIADDDDALSIDGGLIRFVLLSKQNLAAIDVLLVESMDKNTKLDTFVVSRIVETNCDRCRIKGALLAFDYSVKMGFHLEKTAYLALVGSLMRLDEFHKVVEVFQEMLNARNNTLGVYFVAMLIHKLGFCRRPRLAAKIFDLLPEDQKNVATYTVLISVFISAGSPVKAVKIFKEMRKKGISPSISTYNVLLSGLGNTGDFRREVELLRKEKRSLLACSHFRENVPLEEKICNLLYPGSL